MSEHIYQMAAERRAHILKLFDDGLITTEQRDSLLESIETTMSAYTHASEENRRIGERNRAAIRAKYRLW